MTASSLSVHELFAGGNCSRVPKVWLNHHMRYIYLSPHLDDAILSAGGLIYEQTNSGNAVEIWTFMCGVPADLEYSAFAQKLHGQWGFASAEEAVLARREEDKKAAAVVGASCVQFDFLDCIYRRASNGEWPYHKINLPPHEMDRDLPRQIANVILPRLQPDDVLICQLSVGSHIDHVLVRMAAELLGRPLLYDIDVPYIFYKPEELSPKSVGMKGKVRAVGEAGLQFWQEAAREYKSQFVALGDVFDTPEKASESIRSYWTRENGVKLFEIDINSPSLS